jgi:two-component system nitrate/nitrite response regulator NarP
MGAGEQQVWRVLVADDEADLRRLITMAVEFDDRLSVVGAASSGAEAITMAHELQPDLAILDQMLGGPVTGLDVAGHVRATQPHVRLILFSAADHAEDLLAGRVDMTVTKTDIGDLADIACRLLTRDDT